MGATVYVLDENDNILGNFAATAATATVNVDDYLPASSYTLRFTQAIEGDETTQRSTSEEVVVSVPGITYTIENEYVQEGDILVIKFQPHAKGGLTSLTITPPGGVPNDLTQGFFYRAKVNGDYVVTMVAGGVTSTQTITINNFPEFNALYSTTDWTTNDVTLTLDPEAVSNIIAVTINGEAATPNGDGKYVITATNNGSYTVKLYTEAGYVYEKEFVIGNIDKVAPETQFNFNFSVAAGISLDYSSLAVSGGTLYVSRNGGAAEEISDNGTLSLTQAGKYEFTFTNGAGTSAKVGTYYVTYGLDDTNLANVKLGSNGKVSVDNKAATVKLYRAGDEQEIASMKAVKAGKYYLEIANGSDTEIVIFNTDGVKSSGGSPIMIAGIVIGCVALVAAAVVCPVVILKGRKNS